jgi:hypothetical protein
LFSTIALVALALTGCSAATPGGGDAAGSTKPNACAIAHDALAKVVTAPLSAPYLKGDTCYFGVGPNGSQSGARLAQNLSDSVFVRYSTSDPAGDFSGGKIAYSGSKTLSGVGSEAAYYDGGNGNPQVLARTSNAFCSVQTNFNDASEVGLTKPSGSRTIAETDVPKLAADLGGVCTALFGG